MQGKKVPETIYNLYRPVIAELHTWEEMCQMYDEELEIALMMTEILDKEFKKAMK